MRAVRLSAGPEPQPLPTAAFDRPVAEYRRYAEGRGAAMRVAADEVVADLEAGDRAAAERDWGDAYDQHLRLGAAYGALGELDTEIDANPGGLAGGPDDPHFTGLHRVEYEPWNGRSTAAVAPWARRLATDVKRLPRALAAMAISPLDYATRAHETLEDAQRDMLSGVDAPWSGAGLRATGYFFCPRGCRGATDWVGSGLFA